MSDIPNDLRYTRTHEWLRSLPNGQVEIGMSKAADARADSVSGAVTIDLPGGVHPKTSFMSVSGRCVCEPEQGDDCCVTGRTVSGRITVRARR